MRVMFGAAVAVVISVVAGGTRPVRADALAMPYECKSDRGAITLQRAAPQRHEIADARKELDVTVCAGPGRSHCQSIMVHKFRMRCGAATVEWADVADTARRSGAELPDGLPKGYAPLGALGARLVFEPLAAFRAPNAGAGHVERHTLSDDSVRASAAEAHDHAVAAAWSTTVTSNVSGGQAGTLVRVALAAGALLAGIFCVGFVMAGRGGDPLLVGAELQRRLTAVTAWLHGSYMRWYRRGRAEGPDEVALANAMAVATARLAEAELTLSALPRTLLLREVLQGEVEQARARLANITSNKDKFPPQTTAARLRGVLRDLERIMRIADGAAKDTRENRTAESAGALRMPASVPEAYQILGINVDAAPAVAKKLVDALRMSWHPDFARDEADRHTREARMKQINAAWDLIKTRFAQAA